MTMKRSEALRLIDDARDSLLESKRYLSSDLAASERYILDATFNVGLVMPGDTGDRLSANLAVAYNARQQDPGVFRGYVDGVRHELSIYRRTVEKSGEAE